MNKIFRLWLAPFMAAAFLCALSLCPTESFALTDVYAEGTTGSCGTDVTYSIENGILTISGTGAMNNYSSAEDAPYYNYRSDVTRVVISDGVTNIGKYAFCNCEKITSITITESVTAIDNYAFDGCSSLTSITIPSSVTSIGAYAFRNCSSLTGIAIPDDVTDIKNYTFSGCSSLKEITISNKITSIGGFAFQSCSSLTAVTIPSSVTSIGGGAFDNCGSLTDINVDGGNSNYSSDGGVIFSKNGTQLIECPAGKKGEYNIPNTVTAIGIDAFMDCAGLKSITIPDSVTSIGSCAFSGCTGLTSMTIPSSVTSIGAAVFSGCTGLTDIANITIPSSFTAIGSYMFQDCTGLTSITFPSSVASISSGAFLGCTGLTDITIPNSITSIGTSAFESCAGLKSITIPDSITTINDYVFYGCTGLTGSLTIPNSVTSIGNQAFYNCTNLKEITVLNKNAKISRNAFYGVPKLRCFKDSTASKYTQTSGTAPEIVCVQDQSSLETISIPKPTDGKWIQKVELIISVNETQKKAELTRYRLEGENYVFPVLMYADSYMGDERKLSYQVKYYYNYDKTEAKADAFVEPLPASEDSSGNNTTDPSKVYYVDLTNDTADFEITEVTTSQ